MKAIVSEKGQVTIPKAVRQRLGLRPGSALELRAERGRLIGTKVERTDDAVLAVTGIVKAVAVDDYLASIRGPVE